MLLDSNDYVPATRTKIISIVSRIGVAFVAPHAVEIIFSAPALFADHLVVCDVGLDGLIPVITRITNIGSIVPVFVMVFVSDVVEPTFLGPTSRTDHNASARLFSRI